MQAEQISGGISHAILSEAFARMKLRFVAQALPWSRCLDAVRQGRFDAVIDNAPDPSLLHGQHPTAFYPLALFARADTVVPRFSWDAMRAKSVGMVRGFDYTAAILNYKAWNKDLSDSDEMMLKKLAAKRFDYMILDIFSAPILSRELGVPLRQLEPLVDATPLYVSFHKERTALAQGFDRAVAGMISDGTLERIYQAHGGLSYRALQKSTPPP